MQDVVSRCFTAVTLRRSCRNPLPPLVRARSAPVFRLDELLARCLHRPPKPEHVTPVITLRTATIGALERRPAAGSETSGCVGLGAIGKQGNGA